MDSDLLICPICERTIPVSEQSTHHLIPKHKGGISGETIELHRVCHTKIHSIFINTELKVLYNTIENLLEHGEIRKFRRFIRNKPTNFNSPSKLHKKRK